MGKLKHGIYPHDELYDKLEDALREKATWDSEHRYSTAGDTTVPAWAKEALDEYKIEQ